MESRDEGRGSLTARASARFARETDLATIGIRPERARLMVSAIELGRRTVGEAPRVGHRIGNCGIAVLDHIVVASGGYVSIADRGWC